MICSQCGCEVPEGNSFCPFCGEKMPEQQPAGPTPQMQVPNSMSYQTSDLMSNQMTGQTPNQVPVYGNTAPETQKSKSKVPILLAVVGVFILLIAIIIWMVVQIGHKLAGTVTGNTSSYERGGSEPKQELPYGDDAYPAGPVDVSANGNLQIAVDGVDASNIQSKGYLYVNSLGDAIYYLIVTNDSEQDVTVSAKAILYNEKGKKLDDATGYINALGGGETSLATLYFSDGQTAASVDIDILVEKTESYYQPVLSDIDFQVIRQEQNVSVVAENRGEYVAKDVTAYTLFMNEQEQVISYSIAYLSDVNNELCPGDAVCSSSYCYDDFDHAQVYFSGHTSGLTSSEYDAGLVQQLGYEEYLMNDYGNSAHILALTNHSDKTLAVQVDGIALDAEGNILAADMASLDVIGPGEEAPVLLRYRDVTNVAQTKVYLSAKETDRLLPVVANLDCEVEETPERIYFQVTNQGSYSAEYVQAMVVYLDDKNRPVTYATVYIGDEDNAIKPGRTESDSLVIYIDYSSMKVLFTGRHYK